MFPYKLKFCKTCKFLQTTLEGTHNGTFSAVFKRCKIWFNNKSSNDLLRINEEIEDQ